ncbi:MAG TPA: glycosyltransferase family 39 protein [Anaeromyxobacteraceae bacterium]|nr:glycosyltransferase family 39 protein [Anaeromyxobacteraceae bacterium]
MADSCARAVEPAELRGRTEKWGVGCALLLGALVLIALWFRFHALGAEGFADDEVHKWLAANRYLRGQFGGDDVEHPMLMKTLAALVIWAVPRASPEALTRFPGALAGGLTVWATALLGRRLFGRATGLLAAALMALSTTAIGYHRIAKEDSLLGLFFVLCLWCLAEAKAAADDEREREARRWELCGAAALGTAFASKYFLFYGFALPIAYLWLRPTTRWRLPARRWAALSATALAVFLALNWTVLSPTTWDYLLRYMRGEHVGGDRGVSESILFTGRIYGNLAFCRDATPWWFFLAFAAFKFSPVTALLEATGLAWAIVRRAPAHRILLVWIAALLAFSAGVSAKYGRFFVSVMPAFLLLAAHAAVILPRSLAVAFNGRGGNRAARLAGAAAALLAVASETTAAVTHAPHQRLYLSALAGGDRRLNWFLPHCDYFDAGLREALTWVAEHAEKNAEVASDVDWSVRLYAARLGRPDLVSSPILPDLGCQLSRPCYVLVQPGRIYRHNLAALAHLNATAPVHVERIRGEQAVRVYRLGPGEPLFPESAHLKAAAR